MLTFRTCLWSIIHSWYNMKYWRNWWHALRSCKIKGLFFWGSSCLLFIRSSGFGLMYQSRLKFSRNRDSGFPYLAIYHEFGYFWHKFGTKILIWLLGLFGYLWKFVKILDLNQFSTSLHLPFCGLLKKFLAFKRVDMDILGFQKCFDVGLLGFSKIWLLFATTFWQHCRDYKVHRNLGKMPCF